ncbi:hypothetical protein MHM98_06510 [Psychrobium sp. MM17-31]|uniref:hypothetical protein n=1 Tax=Psychrobium sp. MM17-31 TaxID=2917758 RepID=UPI001EF68190|nr:hypothetical protein [Psychrobium sp. MM17-31]MCG7531000.1 hypothetical protein [Psychrobium sp. MM17-31]
MKIKQVTPSIKIFFVSLVALSLGGWQFGFYLGAYDTIFFHYVFSVWFISLAFVLAYFFLPKAQRPFNASALFPLIMPTVWLLLEITKAVMPDNTLIYFTSTIFGVVTLCFCVPYIVYLLISITQSEALNLQPKNLLWYLVLTVFLIFAIAYFVGKNHHIFLTCHDFQISGEAIPENCWKNTME